MLDFKGVERWFLFGGGALLLRCFDQLQGRDVVFVSSERNLADRIVGTDQPLKSHLEARGAAYLCSDDPNTDPAFLSRLGPSVAGISISAPWLFRRELIERFQGRLLNVHGTRLPQDRGGGGFSWRILHGDRLGYFVLHQITPKADAGAILAVHEYVYPASCRTPADYQAHALAQEIEPMGRFLTQALAGDTFSPLHQPEYLSFYWPRLLTDVNGWIDWSWTAKQIETFICAFDDPYKGASTLWNGQRIRLKSAYAVQNDGAFHPFQRGIVYRNHAGRPYIAANDGAIMVESIKAEDGSPLSVPIGDRLITPAETLEAALGRVKIGPKAPN